MWIGIGSILMMFAGLTSAYIVKRAQANWALLEIPTAFWISTGVILLSSVTVYLANKAFHERQMVKYRYLLGATAILGAIFLVLQFVGFASIKGQDIKLVGAGSNASYSFLLAIAGLHGLHVLGGVVALFVIYARAKSAKIRNYSPIPIEVVSTYWHFVDLLWIYLFVFFSLMR
jgi:cytochrome c oxidase subunit III